MISISYLFEVMPNPGYLIKGLSQMVKLNQQEEPNIETSNTKKQIAKKVIKKTIEKVSEEK